MQGMEVYDLIIGILKQAKEDYIVALRKRDFKAINELETFFLSDYGQAMTMNNGERIIKLCKKIAQSKDDNGKRTITYKGETKTLYEWAKIKGISRHALWERIKRGWTVERALETPPMSKEQKK